MKKILASLILFFCLYASIQPQDVFHKSTRDSTFLDVTVNSNVALQQKTEEKDVKFKEDVISKLTDFNNLIDVAIKDYITSKTKTTPAVIDYLSPGDVVTIYKRNWILIFISVCITWFMCVFEFPAILKYGYYKLSTNGEFNQITEKILTFSGLYILLTLIFNGEFIRLLALFKLLG